MSMLKTFRGGFEMVRSGDVTAAETLIDGSTSGYMYCFSDKPSHAIKLGDEYNGVQIFFSAGKGFGEGLHEFSAVPEKECAFQIDGWASNAPAMKICDGSVQVGESRIFPVNDGHDASESLVCCSIALDDEPHPASISVHNVDSTNGIASLTFDTAGLEWLSVTFSDVSAPINAHIRPY